MVFEGIQPEQMAEEWATRVTERMRKMNVAEEEITEVHQIIHSFTKTAVDLIREEPSIDLPYSEQGLPLDNEKAHLVIDLFLRGVNQTAKRLRDKGKPWEQRKPVIEQMAWKIFNLSKLLVGLKHIPNPAFKGILKHDRDLKIMMKHSTEELIRKDLNI